MRCRYFPAIISITALWTILGCYNEPDYPYSKENADISLSLMSSDYSESDSAITDTVGKAVRVNLSLYLAEYIDSVVITATSSSQVDTVIRYYKVDTKSNKISYNLTFSRAGERTVIATGYLGRDCRQAMGVIRIVDRPIPNRKPILMITGPDSVVAGRTCILAISAIDPDSGQTVSIDTLKSPAGTVFVNDTFHWATTAEDTGIDTVVFIASDNAPDRLFDTMRVPITVISIAANRAPRWTSDTVYRTAVVEKQVTLTLAHLCADPDGDTVTYSLVPGTPGDHSVRSGIYSFLPSSSFTGVCLVRIAAVDPFGAAETVTVKLSVVAIDNDTSAPFMQRILPEKDSIYVDTSGFRVAVFCKDLSGIASMRCLMGNSTFNVSRSDSLYIADITGLPSDGFGEISFIAVDGSTHANACTLHVHIKGGCAEIASFTVMDAGDSSVSRWTSVVPAPTSDTSKLIVCNDTAFVRIVTMTRVHEVKISGIPLTESGTSGTVFECRRAYLPKIGNNLLRAEVVSQDLQTIKAYTLTVPSSLKPVILPQVLTPLSGAFKSLLVQCNINGDSRGKGIVVLRAEHELSKAMLSASLAPVEKTALASDTSVTIIKILSADAGQSFTDDSLKPNTTYFYSFVSYGGAAGGFFYGEGREASRATKGRISISATASVLATNVIDGGSDWDWEMFGQIFFCGKALWDVPNDGANIRVNQGSSTGPLGVAVQDTSAPNDDSCTVMFWLSDYDASSGDDGIGSLGLTRISYPEIVGTNKPTPGVYTFTTDKSFLLATESGTGYITYSFKCTYID